MNTHNCSKCKQPKPISDYQLYKERPSGQCRSCKTECEAARRAKNGVKKRKRSYIANGQKFCVSCNKLHNLSFFSPASRGLGGVAAYCKQCTADKYRDPAKSRKTTATYRKRHRARWLASHRITQFKRRSKLAVVTDGTVTDTILKSLYAVTHCVYCKQSTPESERTIDHMTPLSRGGHHSANNLAMACNSCNSAKGSLTEHEYRTKIIPN